MSLRRIGWSLEKGVAIRSDTGEIINMLQTPPRRVAALVERGITRWQMRDAGRCLDFDPIEAPDIWLRHMRCIPRKVSSSPRKSTCSSPWSQEASNVPVG